MTGDLLRQRRRLREARLAVGWLTRTTSPDDIVRAVFAVKGRRWWSQTLWFVHAEFQARLLIEPRIRSSVPDVAFNDSRIHWRWATVEDITAPTTGGPDLSSMQRLELCRAEMTAANRSSRPSLLALIKTART